MPPIVWVGVLLTACSPSATSTWMSGAVLMVGIWCLLPRPARSQAPGSAAPTTGARATKPDKDHDGVADGEDNCPDDHNPEQRDDNANGVGDTCDASMVVCLSIRPPTRFQSGCAVQPGLSQVIDANDIRVRVLAQLPPDVQARLTTDARQV